MTGPPAVTPKLEVGLVLYPGCQSAMIYGMTDMLSVAGHYAVERGGAPLRVSHWQSDADGHWRRCHDTHPELGDETAPAVLVVPGSLKGPMTADEAEPYARWLLDRHANGVTLAATCGGVFAVAATGLLSGRMATTHWYFADVFRDRFPDVRLATDRMVIDDGDLITAGGLMAWTDLGLRLVDRMLGPTVMADTSHFMLVDTRGREQRHYSRFSPRLNHGDEAILKVQHWLQAREARDVTVADMARGAVLEERTFQRRFKAATGLKPIEYVQHLRIGKAQELLEYTRRPIAQVAWEVGYEDPAAFRKVFQRVVGLSPAEYRDRFLAVAGD